MFASAPALLLPEPAHAGAFRNILHRRLRPGENRHLPNGHENITFTLLKHYRDWEKQCRSAVLKFAHLFKIR